MHWLDFVVIGGEIALAILLYELVFVRALRARAKTSS